MILDFIEESEYGQDVLELIAMCVELQEGGRNTTETRKQLKQIRGKIGYIEAQLQQCEVGRLQYMGML